MTAAVMGLALLPSNCWADVHLFWRKFASMGWHHLPYRDFLWEFPTVTVPLVALSRVMGVNSFATVFAAVSAARRMAPGVCWSGYGRTMSGP